MNKTTVILILIWVVILLAYPFLIGKDIGENMGYNKGIKENEDILTQSEERNRELEAEVKRYKEYVHDWASFYCAGKEVEYVTDYSPGLLIEYEDNQITRVSVECQGEPKIKE